jgi:hypothetical protein
MNLNFVLGAAQRFLRKMQNSLVDGAAGGTSFVFFIETVALHSKRS